MPRHPERTPRYLPLATPIVEDWEAATSTPEDDTLEALLTYDQLAWLDELKSELRAEVWS